MDDFVKMDFFFVVATAAVGIMGILVACALFYAVRILRNIARLTGTVEEEARLIRDDVENFRKGVRSEGIAWLRILRRGVVRFFSGRR